MRVEHARSMCRNMEKKSSNRHAGASIRSLSIPTFLAMDRVRGVKAMMRFKALMIAAPMAAALLAAPAAHADWHGHGGGEYHGGGYHGGGYHGGGYHGGGWHGDYHHGGPGVGGALLGLGAAAVIGGVIASQAYAPPPPVYYAPPPAYYAPPPTYYAAPPPGYYPPPGY
jgi:hypothetical protein